MHRKETTAGDKEGSGGWGFFLKQSKATLNAMNVTLSQNVYGISNTYNEVPH